jgi:ppGpp synthetase/RelA/SpoT-type nucleotidyltranferase
MRLSQMQDIAGCRAIVKDMTQLNALVNHYKVKKLSHKYNNQKDYVNNPKSDGYRSHHLIYEYRARKGKSPYDGLRIEIQFRTNLQHAWATAVEAVGIFTRQGLKFNQGNEKWLRFFALMSTAIAAIEKTPSVPDTPLKKREILRELK